MKDCIARPRKIATFLAYKKYHVYVIHNDCHKEPGVFNKWRRFGAPLCDCPPKRLVWIRHWPCTRRLTIPDISKVCACVFWPVISPCASFISEFHLSSW